MVQQSSSQQKHQQMGSNPLVLNNFMQMQPQRNQAQSRKSNGATSATGNRRRVVNESPDMYKMTAH